MSLPVNDDLSKLAELQKLVEACPDGGYSFSHILRDPDTNKPQLINAERWQLCAWSYTDEMRGEKAFVIDKYGRLRKPDEMADYGYRFYAEVAKVEAWLDIQSTWLVLYWAAPMLRGKHVCKIIYRPQIITRAQDERVKMLQKNLEKEWSRKAQDSNMRDGTVMSCVHIEWPLPDSQPQEPSQDFQDLVK